MKRLLTVVLTSMALAGCSSHYLVTSKLIPGRNQIAEIVESPTAVNAKDKIQRVAVKAPDNCGGSGKAAEGVGKTLAGSMIVGDACAVQMAVLERSLARAGYEVISWKLMQQGVASLNLGDQSVSKVASELGADALVQVNSLEVVTGKMIGEPDFQVGYYQSSPSGNRLKTAQPKPGEQELFQAALRPMQQHLRKTELRGVVFDATLLYLPTQQAIWFYKGTAMESPREAMKNEFSALFSCGGSCSLTSSGSSSTDVQAFYLANPLLISGLPGAVADPLSAIVRKRQDPEGSSGRGQAREAGQESKDDADVYYQLVRQVIDDFTNGATKVIRSN